MKVFLLYEFASPFCTKKATFFFAPVFQGIIFHLITPHTLANPTPISSVNLVTEKINGDRLCVVPTLSQLPNEGIKTKNLVKATEFCLTEQIIETKKNPVSQESILETESTIFQANNQLSKMVSEVSPDNNEETLIPETQAIDEKDGNHWHFKFQPYGTISISTYGNTTIRGRTIDYYLDLGSLLNILQFAGSGCLEAWNGNLGFIVDAYYVSFKGTGIKSANPLPNASVESTLSFNQDIYDFALSYRLPKEASNKPFPLLWFEPMVGGKLGLQISNPITFWIRGDASGFGMAEDTDLS